MAWKKTNDVYYGEIASAIRAKNGANNTYTPSQMGAAIESIPAPKPKIESKFINFINYDGTLLYSWTEQELQAATELPALPESDDYIYQEWNWDLENIKSYPYADILYVGAPATPKKAPEGGEIDIFFLKGEPTNPVFTFTLTRCSLEIDWGDGSAKDLITSSSYGGESITISHSYNHSDFYKEYKILLKVIDDYSTESRRVILPQNGFINEIYRKRIKRIFLGKYFISNNGGCSKLSSLEVLCLSNKYANGYSYSSFSGLRSLSTIVIPKSTTVIGNVQFSMSYLLNNICLPDTFNSIEDSAAFKNTNIKIVNFPKTMTHLGRSSFEGCESLYSIIIPNNINKVKSRCFYGCSNLNIIDLSDYSDPNNIPTLENADAFQSISANKKFQARNQLMLDAFIAATNWSTYANNFVIGGKFAEVS